MCYVGQVENKQLARYEIMFILLGMRYGKLLNFNAAQVKLTVSIWILKTMRSGGIML